MEKNVQTENIEKYYQVQKINWKYGLYRYINHFEFPK